MPRASSLLPGRSTPGREHDLRRSRGISSQMPTGKTSSCSLAPKQQRCCSSPRAKIRKRCESPRALSLCLTETSTRCTRRKKLLCQQVCVWSPTVWSLRALTARLFSGTFKTPQILELSGIGDRNLLKSFGIETLIDLPGVGENLLDQTYTLIDYVAKKHVKTLGKSQLSIILDHPFSPSTAP